MLGAAVEDELIARNPCVLKGASVERHDERPVASVNQIARLVEAVEPRYRAMLLWRLGAAFASRVVKVSRQLQELQGGQLVFGPPKTEAGRRTVSIPPHVLPELKAHLETNVDDAPDSLVFASPEGGALRRSNFNRRAWQPACAAAGLDNFHFHDLRHSGNTLAASTGASLKELMRRMGHASPRAAMIYQHATAERDRALAEALSQLATPTAAISNVPNLHLVDADEGNSGRPETSSDGGGCAMDVRLNASEVSTGPSRGPKSPGHASGDDGTRTHDPLRAKQVL